MKNARDDPVVGRGWFAVVYWTLVAAGLGAVVLAFSVGSLEQRIATGAIVFGGVVLLGVARLLILHQRRKTRR